MYNYKTITTIELELTTRCNAACPQCARNINGGAKVPALPLDTWTLDKAKDVFLPEFLKQLELIYLCGTYGDPLIAKDIIPIIKYFKSINPNIKINAHTNGSVRNIQFFKELAKVIDCVIFAIDGLKDTNHLYRRNCKWNKIIDNVTAFISAGGNAKWDYIVFKHNQHQVNEAEQLSKQLGFTSFHIKKSSRFMNYAHRYSSSLQVKDRHGNTEYTIDLPTDPAYINSAYADIVSSNIEDYKNSTCIKCNAMRIQEIYIGADGNVFPCGWLHDRLYPDLVLGSADNVKITEQIHTLPANCFTNTLEEIVDGEWFRYVKDSWTNNNRLDRCAMMCGSGINIIGEQNTNINYKV